MSSVTLTRAYFHDASDLSDYIDARVRDIKVEVERKVWTEEYAQGRIRMKSRPTKTRKATFTLLEVPRDTVDQLDTWCGTLLMLRLPRGHKIYGVVSDLPIGEAIYTEKVPELPITFDLVTASEEV